MWWRQKAAGETEPERSERLVKIDQEIARLDKRLRDLELDWDQTYEKFATLYARMRKRAKLEAERADAQDAPGSTIVAHPGETPKQDRWTALKAAQEAKARRGGTP